MKVLLIQPPYGYATGANLNFKDRVPSISIALPYLAKAVGMSGLHSVKVVDFAANKWRLQQLGSVMLDYKPDVAGITSTTCSYLYAQKISRFLKKVHPKITIVFGGVHSQYQYRDILEQDFADICVIREGELAFAKLLDALEEKHPKLEKVPGIVFLRDGELKVTPIAPWLDINKFGTPDYRALDMDAYIEATGAAVISSSRGCSSGCKFCVIPDLMGSWRAMTPEVMIEHVLFLYNEYGVRNIHFHDATFTYSEERVTAFCNLLRDLKLDLKWSCATRVSNVRRDTLKAMASAGAETIFYGVESGSNRILKVMAKGTSVAMIRQALDETIRQEIRIYPSFIIGFPFETESDIRMTIDFAKSLRDAYASRGFMNKIQFNILAPFPGTNFEILAEKYGLRIRRDIGWDFFPVVSVTWHDELPYELHLELWHEVMQEFFPDYYPQYCDIETQAFTGRNRFMEDWLNGSNITQVD